MLAYRITKDRHVAKKAKQIIHQTILRPIHTFGNDSWTLDKKARSADYNSRHESYQNGTRGNQMGKKRKEELHRQSNLLPIVQVMKKNKLRRFGHVVRRDEESTLRVVMKLNMKVKIPK